MHGNEGRASGYLFPPVTLTQDSPSTAMLDPRLVTGKQSRRQEVMRKHPTVRMFLLIMVWKAVQLDDEEEEAVAGSSVQHILESFMRTSHTTRE